MLSSFFEDELSIQKSLDHEEDEGRYLRTRESECSSQSLPTTQNFDYPAVESTPNDNLHFGKKNVSIPLQDMFIAPTAPTINDRDEISTFHQQDVNTDSSNLCIHDAEIECTNSSDTNYSIKSCRGQFEADEKTIRRIDNDVSSSILVD